MHVGDTVQSQGRLSVFYEQDLGEDEAKLQSTEQFQIRRDADDNNNNNNDNNNDKSNSSFDVNESIESNAHNDSSEYNNATPPPVVRRRKNTLRPRSRERSFVYAASAVVGGARSVARTFKRISLIESNNSNSSMRERASRESIIQDGVAQLKAEAKHKQRYNSTPSLPQSFSSSGAPLQSSGSAHSLGSSPGASSSLCNKSSFSMAKQHDQQAAATSAAAHNSSTSAAAAAAAAAGASTGSAATAGAANTAAAAAASASLQLEKDKDKEKEKKRKEVSSSRVKKFHRHFTQVSKDEKLINYFSCALVGDIPLQGHLYITDEHFAFYSNVFGYVTKVVIPTASVTKISKEKTAKIIPNAVGVATADERHVFGSFISREAAFRLMCTVCSQLASGTEILPKPLPLAEEYLLDDDSSCSISGNESPPQLRDAATSVAVAVAEPDMTLRQRDRHSDLPAKSSSTLALESGQVTIRSSAPPVVHYEEAHAQQASRIPQSATTSAASSSVPASSASSSPITVVGVASNMTAAAAPARSKFNSLRSQWRLQLPTLTELHVLYLGIMLAIMLALFSVFLLYRILDIEAKTNLYNTPIDFNARSGNDEDIFAEALRWQKELQDKSTAEAQHILSKNLEQISKVRRSLETLSMLIHDRRAGLAQPETAEAMAMAAEPELELDANVPVSASGASSDILSD
ncbi:hypothetical protein KR222_011362 [Zaprionus bogoriensis]|nr:hypothetical protein KR222_011362 [Zaprionus bogoriensis]